MNRYLFLLTAFLVAAPVVSAQTICDPYASEGLTATAVVVFMKSIVVVAFLTFLTLSYRAYKQSQFDKLRHLAIPLAICGLIIGFHTFDQIRYDTAYEKYSVLNERADDEWQRCLTTCDNNLECETGCKEAYRSTAPIYTDDPPRPSSLEHRAHDRIKQLLITKGERCN